MNTISVHFILENPSSIKISRFIFLVGYPRQQDKSAYTAASQELKVKLLSEPLESPTKAKVFWKTKVFGYLSNKIEALN